MMMWEKLKLVAVGALAAVGLTVQALSQQATDGGVSRRGRPRPRRNRPKDRREDEGRSTMGPEPAQRGHHRGRRGLLLSLRSRYLVASRRHAVTAGAMRPEPSRTSRATAVSRHGRGATGPHPRRGRSSVVGHRGPGHGQGRAMRDGKPLPGLFETTALLPADAGTCTVRFKVAAGPWNTVGKWGKNRGRLHRTARVTSSVRPSPRGRGRRYRSRMTSRTRPCGSSRSIATARNSRRRSGRAPV